MEKRVNQKKAIIKAVLFAIFIVAAVVVVRATPVKGYLTSESLGTFLEGSGFWAPPAYVLIYAAGVCLFLPGTLLATLGAAAFGPYFGFL